MALISAVTARQILDSRGIPTVEATVTLDSGISESSSAPSGSTSSKLEAVELRDHNPVEYFGLGVSKAVENVNAVISPALVGMDPLYQTQVDQSLVNLDGTVNKSRLGSNAILAVSQAVLKAAAASLKLPVFMYVKEKYQLVDAYRVPTPIFNLLNGGRHGSGALDFQEFQLVPASHLPYAQALRVGVEIFQALDKILEQKGAIRTVGMEGGYSPNLATNTDALEIFSEAMKLTPYSLAQDAFLGLDVAPRWFYKSGKYAIKDRPQPMTGKQMVKLYQDLHQQYRVFSYEDPLLDDAWDDWKFMTAEMGESAMVVADDLVATNKTLLMKAIQEKACNAIVIKPNRAGTITESIEVASLAKQAGWHTIMSHRSGETTDDILADVAVGIGTDYVKFGAPSRGERVVKYNRLLRIEEILLRSNQQSKSPGAHAMEPTNQPTMTTEPAAPAAASPTTVAPTPAPPAPATPAPLTNPEPATVIETPAATSSEVSAPAAPTLGPAMAGPSGPTPFASVFASASPSQPAPPPVAAYMPPGGAPTAATAPEPVAAAETPAPSGPALNPTPVPSITTPEPAPTTEATAPNPSDAGAVPEATAEQLQSSVNELVKMVGPTPAAPSAPAQPTAAAPSLAEETPAPTAPAAFPSGLTPPTPPTYT